ncbi:unnamed protein product, partial [Mesorhabditis spiculigera]
MLIFSLPVRLDSIHALTPLVVHGQLKKEQLDTILKCLDDAMPETRQALRVLLVKGDFADVECIRACIRALLLCMKRYPQDRQQVYKCLSDLGLRHAVMVQAVVVELLNLHPVLSPSSITSTMWNVHLAKAFLLLSAASAHQPVLSLLPSYMIRHYKYLRESVPHLVPVIPSVTGAEHAEIQKRIESIRNEWQGERTPILEQTFERLVGVESETDLITRNMLRRCIAEDVSAISEFNASLAGGARLIASLTNICISTEASMQQMLFGADASATERLIEKELSDVLAARSQFDGVPANIFSFLLECALHLMIIRLIMRVVTQPENALHYLGQLREILGQVASRYKKAKLEMSASAKALLTEAGEICGGPEKEQLSSLGRLSQILARHPPRLPPQLPDAKNIKVKWANIIEPRAEREADLALRFVAGLPSAIPFNVELHNLDQKDIERLRIQITYPDLTETLFRPRLSHLSTVSPGMYKLETQVLVSTLLGWADPADVRLTVALAPPRLDQSSIFPQNCIPLFAHPGRADEASVLVKIHPMRGRC